MASPIRIRIRTGEIRLLTTIVIGAPPATALDRLFRLVVAVADFCLDFWLLCLLGQRLLDAITSCGSILDVCVLCGVVTRV